VEHLEAADDPLASAKVEDFIRSSGKLSRSAGRLSSSRRSGCTAALGGGDPLGDLEQVGAGDVGLAAEWAEDLPRPVDERRRAAGRQGS
jgi:hypothetical protein